MAEAWESAERVQKNDAGQYRAFIGGEWIPVEKAQKNESGQFRVMRSQEKPDSPPPAPLTLEGRTNLRGERSDSPKPLEDIASYFANVATGASGLMRGGANLLSDGLGDKIWPKALGSEGSIGKTVGSLVDPVALAIGGGVLKAVPYAPVLGNGLVQGGVNLAKNAAAGAAMGGAIGGLSDEGTAAGGAGVGAAINVVAPPLVGGATKLAGSVWDAMVGRYGLVNAGKIARSAAGGDLAAIRAATAAAPKDITATQATAGVKNDLWDALGEIAKANDKSNYFSRLADTQQQGRVSDMQRLAGGANQTEARNAAGASQRTLNQITTPMRETELAAANEAGRLKGPLEQEAERLGGAASAKVADVRRMEAARLAAERTAQNTFPVEGLPRVPGRYTYAGDTLEPLAERIGTQSAADSLILGEGSRFSQRLADSLAAHGLRPLNARAVIGSIGAKLRDPSIGTNLNAQKAMSAVSAQIDDWAQKNGGVIDAEALYGIRKNLNDTIESLIGGGDPALTKKAAASIAGQVKPLIDDAIERAGGTGWRGYLKTFEEGMRQIEQGKMAAAGLKMVEKQPAKFESLMAGNEPKSVKDVFGPTKYDIRKEMSPTQLRVMDRVAAELTRDRSIAEGAKRGGQAMQKMLDDHGLSLAIPNLLEREIAWYNRIIKAIEGKLQKSTVDTLMAGMRNGESAAKVLNALPTQEKFIVLKEILPYAAGGAVAASQE